MDRFAPLIRYYRREKRPRVDAEDTWFASQPTLADSIRNAALARDWRGKRLPHGNRLRSDQPRRAEATLLEAEDRIRRCQSFDELHRVIWDCLRGVWKDPELFCYDTALRVGAKLGLKPNKVYLHRGTRVGARKLGLDIRCATLGIKDLPQPLQCLEPREAEDFLCIFKHKF